MIALLISILAALITLFTVLFLVYYSLPQIQLNNQIRTFHSVYNQFNKENGVYLTFDDGPNPLATTQILDILDKYSAKASFFVTARNACKYPQVIQRIVGSGHSIGYHGNRHLHPKSANPFSYKKDLWTGFDQLQKLIPGYSIRLYRPPYGKLNLLTLIFLKQNPQLQTIYWNMDPRDYESENSQQIIDAVTGESDNGSVVLLHDSRDRKGTSLQYTVDALEAIIEDFTERGFLIIPL